MTPDTSTVIYYLGPKWNSGVTLRNQDHALGHLRFVRTAVRDGTVIVAGPFCGLDEVLAGDALGVMVLNLPVDKAAELVATDPAVANQVLQTRVYRLFRAELHDSVLP